jgi:osmoprotectant transport system ATP-binding protein
LLTLDRVFKRYPNGQVAVSDLSFAVDAGETCVLVGPSGCGKTTTLRLINRLVEPSGGRILLNEQDVADTDPVRLRLRMGYVIQQAGLFPHMTVADNIATVPKLLGWNRERIRRRVGELLEVVGLDPAVFARRYPHQLSGGQQQRVGVARALGADPPVLLMDEPFGAVDRVTRDRLQNEFLRIQAQMRKLVIFVTHDIDEAIRMGDRIAVLREGGVLDQYDTPARILAQPATPFVAEFLGPSRGQRRLSVITVDPQRLEKPVALLPKPELPVSATLADALSAMLLNNSDRATISREGKVLGVLTLRALLDTATAVPQPDAP